MGLDMYLYSTEKFKSIKWACTDEEIRIDDKKAKFLRTAILETSDRTIELKNFYIRNLKLKSNLSINTSEVVEINKDTITILSWNKEQKNYTKKKIVLPQSFFYFIT